MTSPKEIHNKIKDVIKYLKYLEVSLLDIDCHFYPEPYASSLCHHYDSLVNKLNEKHRLLFFQGKVPFKNTR